MGIRHIAFAIGAALAIPLSASAQLDNGQVESIAEQCATAQVYYYGNRTVPVSAVARPVYPVPDPTFVPIGVDAPTYPHIAIEGSEPVVYDPPVIGVDSTHDNSYTLQPDCPRFGAFAELLTADGAIVTDFGVPYDASCSSGSCPYLAALAALDILVIAQPLEVGADESAVIVDWVRGDILCDDDCDGRGLIVLSPWELPSLSAELGVTWNDARALGAEFAICGEPRQPMYYEEGALIDHHVISRGMNEKDSVFSVKSFFNGFCFGNQSGGCEWRQLHHLNGTLSLPTSTPSTSVLTHTGGSTSAGVVFELGVGRVFAGTDPEMFAAVIGEALCQIVFGIPVCQYPQPLGMQIHPANQDFVLNVVHWIDGLLPDADGDGITDTDDYCRWQRPLVWPYNDQAFF